MGWWSAQKFDRRVRMLTLVEGAVNDQSTWILLDTGANVSIVSARYAKKLGLRDLPNQDLKYTEWQVLAYAEARDKDLYKKEEKLYEQWLATQPSAVARPEYTHPTSILQHEEDQTVGDNDMNEDRGDVQR
ncbi:hypothetical protein PHMEG_00041070, partial [Phytophthora megakarya]